MNKNKRALVTGGSRGIGKAVSIMLAKRGYDVIINYRSNVQTAEETKQEIEKLNVKCTLLQFDISEFEKTQKSIEDEIAKNGTIDVLVLNAGVRKDALLPLMNKEDWDNVIDVNLKSFYYVTKPIIKGMFQQNFGKVVVISSTSGLTGIPGQCNYSATKWGLIGAAKSLAVEVARKNIIVNVIAPGYIDTEMTQDLKDKHHEIRMQVPARRIGTVDDVADAVEFLISDKATYIIGQVIAVNGGVVT